ncbi:hypothetical protein JCM17846_11960 [Iodidimonas nitroreducens]|uniref:Phosphatidate cytidylyltransferase n=1 Tax=Iodidimonas nitroreducens TaxID=1236968 RepID=A0A5A7N6Z6_9PROT|nr:hypothetical protein [Iodidimonas nitroreducens]GAK32986.1 hypothetical protein AQ1_00867 [alpha proteobacterium Q-1]GER03514.1 hypothetical protein JCM17846_11960 [Iodidimonas nitroreducens]
MNTSLTRTNPHPSAGSNADQRLESLIAAELCRPQPEAVLAAARHAAARLQGADAERSCVLGVLFYGSCLRTGLLTDKILDFYVIVSDYPSAYDKRWLAAANQWLPPNVFYDECQYDGQIIRSKYNIISRDHLHQLVRPECRTVSLWARFAQPLALLIPRDDRVLPDMTKAVAQAIRTTLGATLPLCSHGDGPDRIWPKAFSHTYGAELRSEPPGKGAELYALDATRYQRFFAPALDGLGIAYGRDENGKPIMAQKFSESARGRARRAWAQRRMAGKIITFLRLIKASATFDGGIDYLAWKIERHSGVKLVVSPWQRRHPVLAGLLHFLKLKRRGAFR